MHELDTELAAPDGCRAPSQSRHCGRRPAAVRTWRPMAENEPVPISRRCVVAQTRVCRTFRRRRDRIASRGRAHHGGRAEGAVFGAPPRLGRYVTRLDQAGSRRALNLVDRSYELRFCVMRRRVMPCCHARTRIAASVRCNLSAISFGRRPARANDFSSS